MTEAEEIYPHLENAPITEALIDYRVQPREGVAETLACTLFKQQIPFGITFKGGDTRPSRPDSVLMMEEGPSLRNQHSSYWVRCCVTKRPEKRFSFESTGSAYLQQARAVHELGHKYCILRALSFWKEYAAVAQPVSTIRVAVRFIKTIEAPAAYSGSKQLPSVGANRATGTPAAALTLLNQGGDVRTG